MINLEVRGGLCFILVFNSYPSIVSFLWPMDHSIWQTTHKAEFLLWKLHSLCTILQMHGLLSIKIVHWSYLRERLLLPSITLNRSCDYFIYSSTTQFCNKLPEIAQLQWHSLTVQKSLQIYWALGASSGG